MLLDARLPWALSLFLLDWACFGILPLSFSFFFNVGFINFATPLLWSCAWLWDFLSTYRAIELFFDFCSVLHLVLERVCPSCPCCACCCAAGCWGLSLRFRILDLSILYYICGEFQKDRFLDARPVRRHVVSCCLVVRREYSRQREGRKGKEKTKGRCIISGLSNWNKWPPFGVKRRGSRGTGAGGL